MNPSHQILIGDCLELLRGMPDNSIDSIVTDPPYGLSFMGKRWDYDVPATEVWAECLRVLKPGGHLLAFAGTRTQHRMAVRIEDAGFEIRDMIAWVYGSGFPKSHNGEWGGTALKPALEPVTVARKPLAGTVEANWREHGTGALNIDGCRVSPTGERLGGGDESGKVSKPDGWARPWMDDPEHVAAHSAKMTANVEKATALGRWPANLIHDGSAEVRAAFPDSNGQQGDLKNHGSCRQSPNGIFGGMRPALDHSARVESDKNAARFFYCAKASRSDRNEGVASSNTPAVTTQATMRDREDADWPARNGNHHPTVKPTDLMAYLCRLVTPAGGTVLDPFMGSGSTGKAAIREGFGFIGCELSPEYAAIAQARIDHEAQRLKDLPPPSPQLDIFADNPGSAA